MLRTRLWMGAVLVGLSIGVLVLDFEPYYPFLFVLTALLSLVATYELLHLLDDERRPPSWLAYGGQTALLIANWVPHLEGVPSPLSEPWRLIAGTFAAIVLSAFIREMVIFRGPGHAVTRISLTLFIAAYLGLLPSFFAQLRWLDPPSHDTRDAGAGAGHFRAEVLRRGGVFHRALPRPAQGDAGAESEEDLGRLRWGSGVGGGDGPGDSFASARSSPAATWPGCRPSGSAWSSV